MLKDLTAEGTAAFEVHMAYRCQPSRPNSEVRITIATTATIPTGFKPYVVDLVLAVVLKSIEGNMVLQIKKPPSNRVWYGFTHPPKMEVEILPIVSERKIQIGMVLKAIERQMREVVSSDEPNAQGVAEVVSARSQKASCCPTWTISPSLTLQLSRSAEAFSARRES
jgi:RNase P protein component